MAWGWCVVGMTWSLALEPARNDKNPQRFSRVKVRPAPVASSKDACVPDADPMTLELHALFAELWTAIKQPLEPSVAARAVRGIAEHFGDFRS